ncbi:MAG: hypothetical protein GC192_01075 [Bacteroidetes bacterium]|nr:hypothetical protein [Bacteroidota bacterium]
MCIFPSTLHRVKILESPTPLNPIASNENSVHLSLFNTTSLPRSSALRTEVAEAAVCIGAKSVHHEIMSHAAEGS